MGVIGPIASRALAGEATFIEDFPLKVDRHGFEEQAYFTFCWPIRDETGRVCGFLIPSSETTAKVAAERTAKLLNAELAHRLQNTLAMLQGIANQTSLCRDNRCGPERLPRTRRSAGRVHALLTQTSWNATPLRT
jgi:hypothetical protein